MFPLVDAEGKCTRERKEFREVVRSRYIYIYRERERGQVITSRNGTAGKAKQNTCGFIFNFHDTFADDPPSFRGTQCTRIPCTRIKVLRSDITPTACQVPRGSPIIDEPPTRAVRIFPLRGYSYDCYKQRGPDAIHRRCTTLKRY